METLSQVKLIDSFGSAKKIVDSARISFNKTDFENDVLSLRDKDLIKYLWENNHTSPFRHIHFTFYIKAPIFVFRQWMKHQVGCAWNEASGRYVKFDCEFYEPETFRSHIPNVKQGSGGDILNQHEANQIYRTLLKDAKYAYERLLDLGVCREQARMLLPVSLYSSAYWTCSLHALIHFFNLRLDLHAQKEIRDFAIATKILIQNHKDFDFVLDLCVNDDK